MSEKKHGCLYRCAVVFALLVFAVAISRCLVGDDSAGEPAAVRSYKAREAGKLAEERRKAREDEAARKREEEAARLAAMTPEEKMLKKFKAKCSLWDGAFKPLEKWIKENMKDPDSYKHVKTRYADPDVETGDMAVVLTFRGTNSFGAVVTNRAGCIFNCKTGESREAEFLDE